ncbi:MAG: ferritin-like domain-containing protein [bacterium]
MTPANFWNSFLDEVNASDFKQYLWLRSLSYLEYIGYRKMVKAVPYSDVNLGVFHHLSDEIQHSFMLRELAEKSFGKQNLTEDAQKGLSQIAEDYFQDLDSQVHAWVKDTTGGEDPYLCYMTVSYVIEKRAMKVYPQYFARLTQSPLKVVIQKIIKDESEHLNYLERMIEHFPADLSLKDSPLFEFEENCFIDYIKRMRQYFETSGTNDEIKPVSPPKAFAERRQAG